MELLITGKSIGAGQFFNPLGLILLEETTGGEVRDQTFGSFEGPSEEQISAHRRGYSIPHLHLKMHDPTLVNQEGQRTGFQ